MRAADRHIDPGVYARAQGLDLESQLRVAISVAQAEAIARCPAARTRIDQMARALRRRVTGLEKARRRLEKLGERRARGEDGSHGSR